MAYEYDAIIIGAGSGGLTAYFALSSIGKKVLLIERDKMGGECTNTGCIPSKSLIHHARVFSESRGAAGMTEQLSKYRMKAFEFVREKIKEVRNDEEPEELMQRYKNTVVRGEGKLIDRHTVQVIDKDGQSKHYSSQYIILATGSKARRVPIDGLRDEQLLTNENMFSLREAPKKLLVMGGGPIGCEMAEAMHHLGCEVTIVNQTGHILARSEQEVAVSAEAALQKKGIRILNDSQITQIRGRSASVSQSVSGEIQVQEVEFDFLLQGVGRIPNIDGLGLDTLGIRHDDRRIFVDRHYRTSVKNILAIGDVSSDAKFTHVAEDQARHVMKKMLFPWIRPTDRKPLPYVTYLSDEVAGVGITSDEAIAKYGEKSVLKVSVPFGKSDRSKTDEARSGVVVLVCKRLTGKILGAHLMGRNAGEIISTFTLAIQYGISVYQLNNMIVPYPTLSQIIKSITDEYIGVTVKDWRRDLWYLSRRWIIPAAILTGILIYWLS